MRTAFCALDMNYLRHGESLTGALQCHVRQGARLFKRRSLNNSVASLCSERTGETPVPRGLWSKKKAATWAAFEVSSRLEPIQQPSVYPHVVLVGVAVKPKRHPVELDGTENQLVSTEVQTAAEHHRHPAIPKTSSSSMRTTEQSVGVRREVPLALRDHWTSRVG